MFGFGSKSNLDNFSVKSLRRARIDEEVKYDLLMGSLSTANSKYEGYKLAGAQRDRSDLEIERAALEMSSWAKKRRSTLKQIRQTQSRTRVLDSLIQTIENKEMLKQHGIWAKLEKMKPEDLMKGVVKIATANKESDEKLQQLNNALDAGLDDIVIEAEKDTDEQKAIKEILALRNRS